MDDPHGRALLFDAYSSHGDAVAASLERGQPRPASYYAVCARCDARNAYDELRASVAAPVTPVPPLRRTEIAPAAESRARETACRICPLPVQCSLTPVGSPRRERPPPCGCIDAQRDAPGRGASRGSRWTVGLYGALAGACLFGALFLFTMTAALGSAGTLVALGFASVAFVRGFWRSAM